MNITFIILLTVVAIFFSFTLVSFAATHSATFDLDSSEDYDLTVSVLTMKYDTGGLFSRAKASTTVSTTSGETGYVYVHVTDVEGFMADSKMDFLEATPL